jgi:outer membrane protein assembly factor BamA
MVVFCALFSGAARASSFAGISADSIGLPIDQIRISGNVKTREKYILKWTGLHSGQILSIDRLKFARQELRDTDLFKTITFQTERFENGELTLHIILDERRSWLLLPRASRNSDGDIKAGLRLRMYNLQGGDQTLEMLAQEEEESDGDNSEEFRMRYTLPLYSLPYKLKWQFNRTKTNKEVEDFSNIERIDSASMAVSRDWHIDAIEVPLTIETQITFETRDLDRPYPEELEAREAGDFNRLKLEFILDDVHRERYRRFGSYYSLAISRGVDWLDSDYDSNIVEIQAIRLKRLNRYDNFNYRLVLTASNDSPFDYLLYSIGGGSTIRGLESVDERGDARFFTNIEYVFAYRKHPGLRHTLFVDVGNIYDDLEAIDLTDLHYTIGTGFRWKIESFVKTDLFLDYGYDVEDEDGKLYGGTSLTF